MNAQKITQTFNGLNGWQIAGTYFKLLSARYPVVVELFYLGQKVLYANNMEAGFYQSVLFDRVEITTPLSEEVSFLIAPNKGGSDRLAGEVQVVDGGKARSLADMAFMGAVSSPAVAAKVGIVQLWNPAANTKRLVVGSVGISVSVATSLLVYSAMAALVSGPYSGFSKLNGVTASSGEMYYNNASAVALGVNNIGQLELAANASFVWTPTEPIVLSPGYGLNINTVTVNALLSAMFEFFEESAL